MIKKEKKGIQFDMRNIKNDTTFLGAKAYDELKRSIVHGELKAGDRLTETGLTEMLGVSRTPVREALRRLCYEGYIFMSNGYEVKGVTQKDVQDILEVRRALECEAARIAAKRITAEQKLQLSANFRRSDELQDITDAEERFTRFSQLDREFHTEIFRITGNSRFLDISNSLQDRLHRLRLAAITSEEEMHECLSQHQNILNSILNGEAEHAEFYSRIHLETIENLFSRVLDETL